VKINWDSEVLSSVSKAIHQLKHLSIDIDSIENTADWLAYEEFSFQKITKLEKIQKIL
jgi:hypothetical protein